MLQPIEQLPGAGHLPGHVFFGQRLGYARLARLLRRLLQEQAAVVGVGKLREQNQDAPRFRRRSLPRALVVDHLERGDLLERGADRAKFGRQLHRRVTGKIRRQERERGR